MLECIFVVSSFVGYLLAGGLRSNYFSNTSQQVSSKTRHNTNAVEKIKIPCSGTKSSITPQVLGTPCIHTFGNFNLKYLKILRHFHLGYYNFKVFLRDDYSRGSNYVVRILKHNVPKFHSISISKLFKHFVKDSYYCNFVVTEFVHFSKESS